MISADMTETPSPAEQQPLRGMIDVGYIIRDGRRADGKKWHGFCAREDGVYDLPDGARLYACPNSSTDPVAVIQALTEALEMARSYVEDEVSKRVRQFGPENSPALCAFELQKLGKVDAALALSRAL